MIEAMRRLDRRSGEWAERWPAWMHKAAIHILLIADLLYTGRVYRMINPTVLQPLLLGLVAGMTLLYTAYAVLNGYYGRVVLAVLSVVLIAGQIYNFSALFGTAIEPNAGFGYIWLSTFIVFFIANREGQRRYLARALFSYATAYAIFYVVASIIFATQMLSGDVAAPLIADDVERGKRLYCYVVTGAFAWFGWLQRARSQPSLVNMSMLILCGLAFLLAQSRVISALLFLLSLGYLTNISTAKIRVVCLGVLWFLSALSMYGMLDRQWNPFSVFAGDSSGNFRIWEYELARDMLLNHPISGVGIAPSQWHAWTFLNYDYFAANDLGTMGVWFDWGLIGLLLFMLGSHISCAAVQRVPAKLRSALFLTGCLMAAYGCIAPVIFYPAGATYFAVLLGYWLDTFDSPRTFYRAAIE